MKKPKTNVEAFAYILQSSGTLTSLAERLGVTKQLVSRWKQVPPAYLADVSAVTGLPIDWVLPELEAGMTALLGRPSALLLPDVIRLVQGDSSWRDRKKPPAKKAKKK